MQITNLERPISDIVPHIFKRPVLSVDSKDSLLQAGTFLAIGPQIYVDGLIVIDGGKVLGRIGGQHIIRYILQQPDKWFESDASRIMTSSSIVQASEPLSVALEIFYKTRFAFVPIAIDGKVATTLSMRDVVRLAAGNLNIPAKDISSHLISVRANTSIQKALELMIEKGIRNLAVVGGNSTRIINDRKMLEFLLSYEGRRLAASPMGLDAVSIDLFEMQAARYIKEGTSAGIAAEILSDVKNPCILLDDSVVTPWDIVMRGIFGR